MGRLDELIIDGPQPVRRRDERRQATLRRIVSAVQVLFISAVLTLAYRHFTSALHEVNVNEVDLDWRTLPIGTVKWWSCGGGPRLPDAECGFIIVPTDYHDKSAGVTKVALGRYKATKGPRKGMVVFGAGGPGGAGGQRVQMGGLNMQQSITGEQFDIVGIDQRGIGDTEPATQCFPPGESRALKANTVLDKGFDFSTNVSAPELRASLLRQQIEMDTLIKTQYGMCGVRMGKAVSYMATTTVARDIDFMTTTLEGKDALINYTGGSYGSVVGQYLVNMFPDRVGKVAIDGIVDSVAWANKPNLKWYRQWLGYTEDAYDWFLNGCAKAGPSGCVLAKTDDEDPADIRARLEVFFNELYVQPISVATEDGWGTVTAGMARSLMLRLLQSPTRWEETSVAYAEAMRGNGSTILSIHSTYERYKDMERQAVSCNDAYQAEPSEIPTNEEYVDEMLSVAKDVTSLAFAVITDEPDSGCQYWPVTPPERFTGPWNHTLKNPILVKSNTADPVTPISSARLVKDLLGDSAILVLQNGPGHVTSAVPTLCTINKSRAYFLDGILPEDGHTCELERELFPTKGANVREYTVEEEERIRAALRLDALEKGYAKLE